MHLVVIGPTEGPTRFTLSRDVQRTIKARGVGECATAYEVRPSRASLALKLLKRRLHSFAGEAGSYSLIHATGLLYLEATLEIVDGLAPPPEPNWAGAMRQLRLALGMRQEPFSVIAGVGLNTVSRWERGLLKPDGDPVARIIEAAYQLGLGDCVPDQWPYSLSSAEDAPLDDDDEDDDAGEESEHGEEGDRARYTEGQAGELA